MATDPRLSEEAVAGIRERLEKATDGPWEWKNFGDGPGLYTKYHGSLAVLIGGSRGIETRLDGLLAPACYADPDPEFIAHAPTDVAALLAERDALVAENEKLRGEWEEVGHRCPMCGTGNLNLVDTEAELARWRAVGERVTVALVNTLTDAGKAWRCEYREMGAEIGEEVPIGLDCETAAAILRDLRALAQGGEGDG